MRWLAGLALACTIAGCSAETSEAPEARPVSTDTDQTSASAPKTVTPSVKNDTVAAPVAANPQAVCSETEKVVFSCTMKSGKQASICITGVESAKFAQYRFGPKNRPAELVWPAAAGADRLAFKSVPYSGGGEAQISFRNGETTYVAFSRMVRTNFTAGEPNYPKIEDGILVMRDGNMLGELLCEGDQAEMPIQYALAEQFSDEAPEMIYPDE